MYKKHPQIPPEEEEETPPKSDNLGQNPGTMWGRGRFCGVSFGVFSREWE